MAHPGQIRKLTYEDYCLYPDDGNRHEILDGEHYMSPAPRTQHQRVSMRLSRILDEYARRHALGEVLYAPVDVLLSPYDVVQPDLLFISAARAEITTEKNIQGAPDLLIEIISPTTRSIDEDLKLQRYEKLGVAEYWLVYPDQARVRVYRRASGGFGPSTDFAVGATNDWRGPLPGCAGHPAWARAGSGPGEPKPARASRGHAASFAESRPPVGVPRPFAPILPPVQTARLPRLASPLLPGLEVAVGDLFA